MTVDDHASQIRLVVVVVAHNEAERIGGCMRSIAGQLAAAAVRVLVSDNASTDGTSDLAGIAADGLDVTIRTTTPLGPSEHFVSSGKWALESEPDAEFFAYLAGDDTWGPGFTDAALAALHGAPDCGMAFPTFVWEGEAGEERRLAPLALGHRSSRARQLRALVAADGRELANLVYGMYRRAAFADLMTAWESGGEHFAADYAAVWRLLAGQRSVICPDAEGFRHVRRGANLLERVGLPRASASGVVATSRLYLRLNLRINSQKAAALARTTTHAPPAWVVQVLRAPQWLWSGFRRLGHGALRVGGSG